MDESRIIDWEKKLHITPLPNSTIEDRREVILARYRGQSKLNTASIQMLVNTFTGNSARTWFEDGKVYVEIAVPSNKKQYKFENVESELRKQIPAHLGLVVTRKYNNWKKLRQNNSDWQSVKDTFETWEDVALADYE